MRFARTRGALWALLASFAALLAPACGDPEGQVIARFSGEAGVAGDAGSGGMAGAVSGGNAGIDTDAGASGAVDGGLTISRPRGRVKVVGGQLTTDVGTPLRGLLTPVDTAWKLEDFAQLHTLAETTGLNAVHVYLENSSVTVGDNQDAGDALVALAAQEGLYVVIGYGTGVNIGKVDSAQLKAFWTRYAARYGSQSHVLFEIQNNPEVTCDKPVSAATLSTELDTYALIRSEAPDSHVILFSTTSIIQPSVFTAAVEKLGAGVDWGNASFALGVTDSCLALADFPTLTAAAKSARVPLLVNQLPVDDWAPYIPVLEQAGVSWFQFRWFGDQKETLQTFVSAVTAAGVSWCPERGTFPEVAATCR